MLDFGFEVGMAMGRSGLAKRASTWADWWDVGVLARSFFVGREVRWEVDVGMDSGMGSDIFTGGMWCCSSVARLAFKMRSADVVVRKFGQ